MPELGNLTVCIFLPPGRLSTVKIRAGSLFCTVTARIGALGAHFRPAALPIPPGSLGQSPFSSAIHSPRRRYTGCTQAPQV